MGNSPKIEILRDFIYSFEIFGICTSINIIINSFELNFLLVFVQFTILVIITEDDPLFNGCASITSSDSVTICIKLTFAGIKIRILMCLADFARQKARSGGPTWTSRMPLDEFFKLFLHNLVQ